MLERFPTGIAPLIATGIGERLAGVARGAFESVGVRVEVDICGRGVVRVGVGVLGVLGELEADIWDVWGSLGPLLKGLNSQEGASFAKVPRAGESRRAFADVAEMVERKECIEDCDGEVLSLVNDGVATLLGVSSTGRSTITRLGLSSIG